LELQSQYGFHGDFILKIINIYQENDQT